MLHMKRFSAALAVLSLAVGVATAVPYASMIRVGDTTFEAGAGTAISYVLNEPSDTVTIEVINVDTSAVVATFAGTTTRGENSVTWNGTVDNGSGDEVAPGNYNIVITADKNNTAWAEISSQRSLANAGPGNTIYNSIYNGYSPTYLLAVQDTSSDFFGNLYSVVSYSGTPNPAQASIVLRSDLEVAGGGDGYETRVLREPTYDGKTNALDTTMWGSCVDPDDSNIVYIAGQSNPTFWYGDLSNPETLVNADPNDYLKADVPRSVVVVKEGNDKYAYFANGYLIRKVPMNGNVLSGPPVDVNNFPTNRYALDLDVDKDGNLYFVSRWTSTSSPATGFLLRWDAADIQGPNPTLSFTNAKWHIRAVTGMNSLHGPAISPVDGNVYVMASNGIYLAGNTATATINKDLSLADRVVDPTTVGTGWAWNTVSGTVRCDSAGNFIVSERSQEQIRMFTPGGPSSIANPAPASQALTITPRASVQDWATY